MNRKRRLSFRLLRSRFLEWLLRQANRLGYHQFCDFCVCRDCRRGDSSWLSHAETSTGRWICSTCYEYDVCTANQPNGGSPCINHDCEHRPSIVSKWIKP